MPLHCHLRCAFSCRHLSEMSSIYLMVALVVAALPQLVDGRLTMIEEYYAVTSLLS